MLVSEIADVLEQWAPLNVAESYDNVGLLVGEAHTVCTGILVNLDVTESVVREAISKQCNLIVVHHPIWFSGRKKLVGDDYVSRTIMLALRNNICIYAIHTNLDNIRTGVNAKIAERLGLQELSFLEPKKNTNEYGSGLIGKLEKPLEKEAFLAKVKESFHCGGIRYADAPLTNIQRVAVCGGSGSFLVSAAIQQKADALITADITYHKFFDNEEQLLLLDIGHYESEQFTSQLLVSYLSEKFPTFAICFSDTHTNPVKYY